MEAPPIVEDVLATPGQPLAQSARRTLEPGLGHDFSGVRVHDDSRAAESASAVNALAYTVGNHIVFGVGQYAPGTKDGNRLLAHELTHVVQQGGGPGGGLLPVGTAYSSESFSRISVFPPERPGGPQTLSPASAPPVPGIMQSRIVVGEVNDPLEAEAVAGRVIGAVQTGHNPSNLQLGRVLRQTDLSEEGGQNNQDTQGSQGSQYIDITDDLGFEPDDTQLQMFADPSLGPLQIQRQPDIPPPPPPFPTGPQMALEMDDTTLLWNLTCMDRKERGYPILWDETTKKSFHEDVARGEPAKCGQAPEVNLRFPPDRGHIWTVGFLHTHPPAGPNCKKSKVGPSEVDLKLAKDNGLPGIVLDTSTPQASCADEPNGVFYFFGPPDRDHT